MALHTDYILRCLYIGKKKNLDFWGPGKKNMWSFRTILCSVSSYNLSFQEKMGSSPQSQAVLCSKGIRAT